MRKIFIILFCMIALIGIVSAAEWDNVVRYADDDMKITIKNYLGLLGWLGIDDKIGTARLRSHVSIDHVKNVEIGNSVVMWYEFNFEATYYEGLGKISFEDMHTGKIIEKDYDFVRLISEKYQSPIYEEQCSLIRNGTNFCEEVVTTYEEKVRKRWVDYDSKDIPQGKSIIGLRTNINPLQQIDIVWTVAGKEISKHAVVVGTYQFTHNASTGADEAVTTWSSVNFSVADTNRVIVVGTGGRKSAPQARVVTMTIGGINATKAIAGNQSGSGAELWYASVPTGTSGDVVVTWDGTQLRSGMGAWAIYIVNATPFDTDEYDQTTATATLNVPTDGVVIAYEYAGSGLGITWTGITEDFDQETENSQTSSGGMNSTFLTTINNHNIVTSRSDLNNDIMVASSWGPTPTAGLVVTLNSPENELNTTLTSVTFNGTASDDIDLINVSIFLDDKLNQTNSSGLNASNYIFTIDNIAYGTHNWTYQICDGETNCLNATTRNFTIANFFEISKTSNDWTFETKTETFIINITTDGSTPSAAILDYNNENKGTATITNTGGNNFNISRTINIPTEIGNKTWKFNFTIDGGSSNSIPHQQRVVQINLTVCGVPPQDKPYMNFTFTNETAALQDIEASIDTSWIYYIGTGTENKSLSYTNSTESHNYTFCFYPENQTISSTLTMRYTNTKSQQRRYNPTLLTLSNVTTTQKLYLLPTILGLFSQFRTEDTLGSTLVGVTSLITRTLVGTLITVTSDVTDGSGLVVFFLDPDITYTAAFSLSGYSTNTFTFVPITGLRTVIIASLTEIPTNGSTIALGTTYEIQPNNDSLNNNTIVTFSFNVTSDQTITLISMNITNTTHQIGFQSNAGTGFISENINTRNNTRMFGEFIIQTANETTTIKRVWNIGVSFVGEYSLFNQMELYKEYGFNFFWRLLIVISVIIGLLFLMSKGNQLEDEIKIAAVICVILGFSVVGWLDTGIMIDSSSEAVNDLARISSQFGIAILTTATGLYFILRRVFRQI